MTNFLRFSEVQSNVGEFTAQEVILGIKDSFLINHILLLGKYMKAKKICLSNDVLFLKLMIDKGSERYILGNLGKERLYRDKWGVIDNKVHRDQGGVGLC